MTERVILGIDAAWTASQPSGVALVQGGGSRGRLRAVAPSYSSFCGLDRQGQCGAPMRDTPDAPALLAACHRFCGSMPVVVAIDMPLSRLPIAGRRESDNAVSRAYGSRHCSTHTPSAERPGPISDRLRADFERAGFALATCNQQPPSLIEVYPHPALVELTGASRRLPYKVAKLRSYWPDQPPLERRKAIIGVWTSILSRLDREVEGVEAQLVIPEPDADGRRLKAFEDMLDAVICAWVGIRFHEGRAKSFGDETSAIWIPTEEDR